jgi:rod shape-determining protein MreD
MLFVLLFGVGLIAVLLQTTLFHLFPVPGMVPDLMVVLTVYLAIRLPALAGAVGAFLLGYALDTFSGKYMGLNAFSLSLIFLLIHSTSRWMWTDNPFSASVAVFLSSWVRAASLVALLALFRPEEGRGLVLLEFVLFESLLAALVAPWIFSGLDRIRILFGLR